MAKKRLKRPRDPTARAKLIGDNATGKVEDHVEDERDPAAVELGRRGGLKGGKARAKSLPPEERTRLARNAAQIRWSNQCKT